MSLHHSFYRMWRQKIWVWAPALVFFGLNLALFSAYRMVYAGQVENLRDRLESRTEELEELDEEARELQELVDSARETQADLGRLYEERLASERTRFTKVTSEVRDLARRSGLEPSAMSYPTEEIEDYGLTKRYFTFSVSGTYVELRRFINLLELTPTFITLEQVSLSGENDQQNRLRIRLSLSTLFADEGAAPAGAVTARSGPGGTDRQETTTGGGAT